MYQHTFPFFLLLIFVFSIELSAQSNDWIAPTETASYVNPLEHSERIATAGNQIYQQLCAVCHGKKGKGDGITAASLVPRPANFLVEKIQKQEDGALYWKINEGRPPMPGFKTQLSEKQVWALVVFIKSLSTEQEN